MLSPSVWWDAKSILNVVTQAKPDPRPRIWLDMGTQEGKRTLQDTEALHRLLVQQGWKEGKDVTYMRVAGGTHDELAWATRVGPFLKFLFPATDSVQ